MKKLLLIAVLLLALLSALGWIVVGTGWGLRFALDRVDAWSPVELRVDRTEGRLLGPVTLTGLRVQGTGWSFVAERLEVAWRPLDLLDRTLAIEQISGRSLELVITAEPSPEEPEPVGPPGLESDWNVQLGGLDVDELVVTRAEQHLVLDDISAAGQLTGHRLTVRQLALDLSDRRIQLAGQVETADRYAHELELSVSDPEMVVSATGDRRETSLSVQAAPWGLRASGRANDLFEDPTWTVQGGLQPDDPSLPEATFDFSGTTTSARGNLTLELGARTLSFSEIETRWSDALTVSAERWTLDDPPLSGGLQLARNPAGELDASIDFDGRLADQPVVGNLRASGAPDSYRLSGAGSGLEHWAWRLSGNGDTEGLADLELALDGGDAGSATAGGRLSWAPEVSWHLNWQARGLNPASFTEGWTGALDLDGEARGTTDSADLRLSSISGTLLDQPLAGTARLSLVPAGAETIEADLSVGGSRVEVSGTWAADQHLTGRVDVVDLGNLHPEAGGTVEADFDLKPRELQLDLAGRSLSYRAHAVASISATGGVSLAENGTSDFTFSGQGLRLAGEPIDRLTGTAKGPAGALAVNLQMAGERGVVSGALTADLLDKPRRIALETLRLEDDSFGSWSLEESTTVAVDAGLFRLQPACLTASSGKLCAMADVSAEQAGRVEIELIGAAAQLLELPLSALAEEPVHLGGKLDGQLVAETTGLKLASLEARVEGHAEIALPAREEFTALELEHFEVGLDGTGERLDGTLAARAGDASATGAFHLLDPMGESPVLEDSSLDLEIARLTRFEAWVPQLADLSGTAKARLQVSGPISNPDLSGSGEVGGLVFTVPDYGTRVKDGTMRITIAPDGELEVSAALPTGEGTLRGEGSGRLEGARIAALDLVVTGERVIFADAPDLTLITSPNLQLQRKADRTRITGTLRIDAATIERRLAEAEVRPSPDVVLVGETRVQETGLLDRADIQITVAIPEPVRFSGFGMDARLTGELTVADRPGEPQRASGELRLSGTYEAYGQELTIEDGRLIYSGTSLDNPGLRIEAFRDVDGVKAGVRVTGRAASPRVELYSEPAMEDSSILAYLLLGRSLNEATSDQAGDLRNAALAIAMSAGNDLSQGVGGTLGLEQLTLTVSEDLGGAALIIGRQIARNLFLTYSIGLFAPVDLLELQYRLSEHWSLETQVGTEARVSLRYRIETD